MVQKNDRVRHRTKGDFSNKRYLMICGSGFPDFSGNFEPAIAQFKSCFGEGALSICVAEAPMFSEPKAEAVTALKLEQVKEAGKEIFNTGHISEGLFKELEVPMIPNDVYISIVNGNAIN